MSKQQVFATITEVEALEAAVRLAADKALRQIEAAAAGSLARLWELKATPSGYDPLNPVRPLNFIEQINQSFTYLATAKALRYLLEHYPGFGPFKANLGTASGSDIEARDPVDLAAEVFAATSPASNGKLRRDIEKVSATPARHRFAFLMCPGIAEGRRVNQERNGVIVWSVGPP